ncbi:MAG: sulfite dehydrogenase [Nitrospira sp. CG24D]|nr:MAG: sulfite dehydrogenase [Nitrospira sp. CG24D]
MSLPDQTQPAPRERETAREEHIDRRAWLVSAVSSMGATAAGLMVPSLLPAAEHANPDPTHVPGRPSSPYGSRARGETAQRLTTATHSLTPHQTLHGIITPSALHFERHHNGVPMIDPDQHRLLIHGLVERPLTFSMNDLMRFPSVTRTLFIECSGNSGKEWNGPTGKTVQDTHGLMSTSEWTGVPLATVLTEAGINPEAAWVLAEGSDAAAMTRSLPLAEVLKDALLCYAQNGERLRPEQGYPLRLVIPGWEGNTCIKWIRRLKVGIAPFMTREETSRYTDLMPDGTARQFTFVMDAKSVTTNPSGGQRIEPGFVEIRGLAWSGRGKIVTVDVSTDGGQIWTPAQLQDPVLSHCHTRFRFRWRWDGEDAILQSRCTDETGYVQPTRASLVAARGIHSSYHYNAIQSWKVGRDGQVTNVQV